METENKNIEIIDGKKLVRTFHIDSGDGEFVYTTAKSVKDHLEADLNDWEELAVCHPAAFGDQILDISIRSTFKYTQEEIDQLPER